MKGFLQLIEEQESTKKPVVMAFGRMNPPTTGHLKLIDKVRDEAEKRGAKHTVVVSHTQDTKKNPLSSGQKLKHLKRFSPGTHFQASTKEHPTMFHQAAKLSAAGHDHLIMVAGSDRVKEYHHLLHKYNGVKSSTGEGYHFKKIDVVSAGHRDPDADGAEGISGTKMREHAKNKDLSSFRQGVPSHVSDHDTKELMHDTRKGMGLNEDVDRGLFKAIFITGGPGSGKDILIRQAIAESKCVEINYIQAQEYLKNTTTRGPLIVNGPADNHEAIKTIKEELENIGYQTMMLFVTTSNQVSQDRNSKLGRMMVESVRWDRWMTSQKNGPKFQNMFEEFKVFENSSNIDTVTKEQDIHEVYQGVNGFLDTKVTNETALEWLDQNGKLDINDKINSLFSEEKDDKKLVKKSIKSVQGNQGDTIKGGSGGDPLKPGAGPGYTFRTYHEQSEPTLHVSGPVVVKRFYTDKETQKKKKTGATAGVTQKINPGGVGPEYSVRAQGNPGTIGGLGQEQIDFRSFRKKVVEAIDSPLESGPTMGVTGPQGPHGMDEPNRKPTGATGTDAVKPKKKRK